MPEIDFKSAIETNWIKLGTMEMEATGNMLGVVQDDFKFGTECLVCEGKDIRMTSQTEQRSFVTCEDCKGNGERKSVTYIRRDNNDVPLESIKKCSTCAGLGAHVCTACNGTGAEGSTVVHPKDREQRPTTGTVVSIGDKVTRYKRGDSVIYPSFAGHFFKLTAEDLNGNLIDVEFGLLREEEVIARVKGHLELRRVKRSAAMHTAA